jgi:hypothetical protein
LMLVINTNVDGLKLMFDPSKLGLGTL